MCEIIYKQKIRTHYQSVRCSDNLFLVGEGGFEPPKALPADLQSVPFGHSGTPPYELVPFPPSRAQRSGSARKRRNGGTAELSSLRGSERSAVHSDDGAGGRIRTPDLLITNQLLYQLSYTSISATKRILTDLPVFVKLYFQKTGGKVFAL